MQKQQIEIEISHSIDWYPEVEISQLKKDIEHLEQLGATHVKIEIASIYDCSYVDISAFCSRMETDEEFEQREKDIKKKQEHIRQSELRQLELLKQKYG